MRLTSLKAVNPTSKALPRVNVGFLPFLCGWVCLSSDEALLPKKHPQLFLKNPFQKLRINRLSNLPLCNWLIKTLIKTDIVTILSSTSSCENISHRHSHSISECQSQCYFLTMLPFPLPHPRKALVNRERWESGIISICTTLPWVSTSELLSSDFVFTTVSRVGQPERAAKWKFEPRIPRSQSKTRTTAPHWMPKIGLLAAGREEGVWLSHYRKDTQSVILEPNVA